MQKRSSVPFPFKSRSVDSLSAGIQIVSRHSLEIQKQRERKLLFHLFSLIHEKELPNEWKLIPTEKRIYILDITGYLKYRKYIINICIRILSLNVFDYLIDYRICNSNTLNNILFQIFLFHFTITFCALCILI